MRVVLNEPPHTRQTGKSTRRLVSVEDTKLGHANGELLVTPVARVEDETVPWAVHGLESPLLLLDVEREHVILVVLPVA